MTLTVNLNPFSRFDGYYFVSDALGIENLQSRALAYTGWACGRVLFGSIEAAPEALGRHRAIGFVGYGVLVWVYRLGLYTGMAALAYKFLFAAAGLLTMAFELWVFVVKPLVRKAGGWWSLRARVTESRRLAPGRRRLRVRAADRDAVRPQRRGTGDADLATRDRPAVARECAGRRGPDRAGPGGARRAGVVAARITGTGHQARVREHPSPVGRRAPRPHLGRRPRSRRVHRPRPRTQRGPGRPGGARRSRGAARTPRTRRRARRRRAVQPASRSVGPTRPGRWRASCTGTGAMHAASSTSATWLDCSPVPSGASSRKTRRSAR